MQKSLWWPGLQDSGFLGKKDSTGLVQLFGELPSYIYQDSKSLYDVIKQFDSYVCRKKLLLAF